MPDSCRKAFAGGGLRTFVMCLAAIAWSGAHAQAWRPSQNVEIVIPAGAGGAIDKTGRLYQSLLKQAGVADVTSSVVNKTGGGHSIGYAYLNQHAGDPHYLLVTSTNLVTNQIAGTSPIGFSDVTPISLLFNEYVVFCVLTDSAMKDGKQLLSMLKDRSDEVSIGVGSAIRGANAVAVGLIGKAAGTPMQKLRMVTFKSSTEGTVQLMGGHISMVATTPGIVLPHITGGRLRALAAAAPTRLGGPLADTPTWKEQGVDVVVGNWRILIAPKGLSADAADYWDQITEKISASDAWRSDMKRIAAQLEYKNRRETGKFLVEQSTLFREAFSELGGRKK